MITTDVMAAVLAAIELGFAQHAWFVAREKALELARAAAEARLEDAEARQNYEALFARANALVADEQKKVQPTYEGVDIGTKESVTPGAKVIEAPEGVKKLSAVYRDVLTALERQETHHSHDGKFTVAALPGSGPLSGKMGCSWCARTWRYRIGLAGVTTAVCLKGNGQCKLAWDVDPVSPPVKLAFKRTAVPSNIKALPLEDFRAFLVSKLVGIEPQHTSPVLGELVYVLPGSSRSDGALSCSGCRRVWQYTTGKEGGFFTVAGPGDGKCKLAWDAERVGPPIDRKAAEANGLVINEAEVAANKKRESNEPTPARLRKRERDRKRSQAGRDAKKAIERQANAEAVAAAVGPAPIAEFVRQVAASAPPQRQVCAYCCSEAVAGGTRCSKCLYKYGTAEPMLDEDVEAQLVAAGHPRKPKIGKKRA